MVIKDVLEQLETANHPVAKQLHKGDNFKVIIMGFKNGMKLKEHNAPMPSKLIIIPGKRNLQSRGNRNRITTV
jgi:quercetin dioxygenase-like cupin family protein